MMSDDAFMIYRDIVQNMLGLYLTNTRLTNVFILEDMVLASGNGDHLEIGTYCGGSALMVALLKKHYKLSGKVVAVDPFNPDLYHPDAIRDLGFYPVPQTVKYNAKKFGVEIEVIQSNSNPLPVSGPFASAYIDGDHTNEAVTKDWQNVSPLVTGAIVLDDTWSQGVKRVFQNASSSVWSKIDREKVCMLTRK